MVKSFIFARLDLRLGFGREVSTPSLSIGELIPRLQWCIRAAAMLDLVDLPVGLGHITALCMTHTEHTRQADGLIPKNWTVEKCSSAQVKGAEGNEEKSVQ